MERIEKLQKRRGLLKEILERGEKFRIGENIFYKFRTRSGKYVLVCFQRIISRKTIAESLKEKYREREFIYLR